MKIEVPDTDNLETVDLSVIQSRLLVFGWQRNVELQIKRQKCHVAKFNTFVSANDFCGLVFQGLARLVGPERKLLLWALPLLEGSRTPCSAIQRMTHFICTVVMSVLTPGCHGPYWHSN